MEKKPGDIAERAIFKMRDYLGMRGVDVEELTPIVLGRRRLRGGRRGAGIGRLSLSWCEPGEAPARPHAEAEEEEGVKAVEGGLRIRGRERVDTPDAAAAAGPLARPVVALAQDVAHGLFSHASRPHVAWLLGLLRRRGLRFSTSLKKFASSSSRNDLSYDFQSHN